MDRLIERRRNGCSHYAMLKGSLILPQIWFSSLSRLCYLSGFTMAPVSTPLTDWLCCVCVCLLRVVYSSYPVCSVFTCSKGQWYRSHLAGRLFRSPTPPCHHYGLPNNTHIPEPKKQTLYVFPVPLYSQVAPSARLTKCYLSNLILKHCVMCVTVCDSMLMFAGNCVQILSCLFTH